MERKKESNTPKKGSNIAWNCISKWVKNCSDRILSDPELSVLAKGLNFTVTPAKLPIVDIVTTTEVACRNLSGSDASELRAKVVNLVSRPNANNIDSNLSKEDRKALQDLQKDKDIQLLPADKGRVVVVLLNTEDYHRKCEQLLIVTPIPIKTLVKRTQHPNTRKNLCLCCKNLRRRRVSIELSTVNCTLPLKLHLSFTDCRKCTNRILRSVL